MASNLNINYVGQIILLPITRKVDGLLLCDGTLYNKSLYATLFGLIAFTFGGDGQSMFAVPDLRGVFPFGATPKAGPGYRTVLYDENFNGTLNQPVTAEDLPSLPATFSGSSMTLSGPLAVKATQATGQGTPQTDYVLGNGGSAAGSANIYVKPDSVTNPIRLDGGTVEVSGVAEGDVSVNPNGQGTLPITIPGFSLGFYIAYEGIFPPPAA